VSAAPEGLHLSRQSRQAAACDGSGPRRSNATRRVTRTERSEGGLDAAEQMMKIGRVNDNNILRNPAGVRVASPVLLLLLVLLAVAWGGFGPPFDPPGDGSAPFHTWDAGHLTFPTPVSGTLRIDGNDHERTNDSSGVGILQLITGGSGPCSRSAESSSCRPLAERLPYHPNAPPGRVIWRV
jgi:hypothetical protein